MASEIRVDKINSLSGVGTVTLSPTGVDISGITTVSTLKVGTGLTASSDGDVFFTGIATATTFVGNLTGDPTGSGANLTALPAGQLTGTVADARISTLTSSKLSGALPAISALNLTNVPAANVVGVHTSLTVTNATTTGTAVVGGGVTISESGIEASGIGITCANLNGGQFGRRNTLINGAMQIAQRGTSITTSDNTEHYTMDRWRLYCQNTGSRFTVTQSTDTPDGFGNSLKIDCTTADTSLASNEEVQLWQKIEGFNTQAYAKGTSAAKQYTLSFYVKTNKTGTYIVRLLSRDNTNGCVSASYTVSDTNWNRYIVTFPADTSSGRADNNDNGESLRAVWWLVAGSAVNSGTLQTTWVNSTDTGAATGQVNFADSTSNDFYLTGCQLEVGSQATAFEHRSFGEELTLCQRYFCKSYRQGVDPGAASSAADIVSKRNEDYSNGRTDHHINYSYPAEMRSTPTLTFYSYDGTSSKFTESEWNFSSASNKNAQGAVKHGRRNISSIQFGNSLSAGLFAYFHFTADAEL